MILLAILAGAILMCLILGAEGGGGWYSCVDAEMAKILDDPRNEKAARFMVAHCHDNYKFWVDKDGLLKYKPMTNHQRGGRKE